MKGLISIAAALATTLFFSTALTADYSTLTEKQKKDTKYPGHIIPYTPYTKPLADTRAFLKKKAKGLKPEVMEVTVASLECAKEHGNKHNKILTIIDYSMPSNKKRMWVLDMEKEKLLYHTYVSHAIMSGTKESKNFSNKKDSKTSSLGVFNVENKYYGRYGAALKLQGLDKGFNDKAYKRFIVLHGSWYTTDKFIKKYGRAGRSWGCPTVPIHKAEGIVNTIRDMSFMVTYYPEHKWLAKSKFLNCKALAGLKLKSMKKNGTKFIKEKEARKAIMFADKNRNGRRDKFEPIIVVKADDYMKVFKKKAPLKRMVRRRIKEREYIALTQNELNQINKQKLNIHYFVEPRIIRKNGRYFQTKIVVIEKQPDSTIKRTGAFIRWLGL